MFGVPDFAQYRNASCRLYSDAAFHGTMSRCFSAQPRGSRYTTIMELGHQNHNTHGFLGPNSIIVVYMDPLGKVLWPPALYIPGYGRHNVGTETLGL